MDPINVDFTGRGRDDGKKGVADVLIPPEHSGKKIAINIILTLILGAVLYYFMIPALNFKSIELYLFVVFVCLIYLLLTIISSRAYRPRRQRISSTDRMHAMRSMKLRTADTSASVR